jgi:hypothetical protein
MRAEPSENATDPPAGSNPLPAPVRMADWAAYALAVALDDDVTDEPTDVPPLSATYETERPPSAISSAAAPSPIDDRHAILDDARSAAGTPFSIPDAYSTPASSVEALPVEAPIPMNWAAPVGEVTYHTARAEAAKRQDSISDAELKAFFGSDIYPKDSRRKILAFYRVLVDNNVQKLSDLASIPKPERRNRIDHYQLATDLGVHQFFFRQLRRRITLAADVKAILPRWIDDVMEKFSINERREPLRQPQRLKPGPTNEDSDEPVAAPPGPPTDPSPNPAVSDMPGPSNAGKSHRAPALAAAVPSLPPTGRVFQDLIDEAKALQASLTREEISTYFNKVIGHGAANDNLRKLLAFARVLDKYSVESITELRDYPDTVSGFSDMRKLAKSLDIKYESFRCYFRTDKDKGNAPSKWKRRLLPKLGIKSWANAAPDEAD